MEFRYVEYVTIKVRYCYKDRNVYWVEISKYTSNCSYCFIFEALLFEWCGIAAHSLYMKADERIAKSKFKSKCRYENEK